MCMRRKGTACETAHFMVPPVGVTEKPSADFQNVQVALFLGRVASECTLPVIDRKSTRLNSSHLGISYAVFCLKKEELLGEGARGGWQLRGGGAVCLAVLLF